MLRRLAPLGTRIGLVAAAPFFALITFDFLGLEDK
jgi:hypothetical protein